MEIENMNAVEIEETAEMVPAELAGGFDLSADFTRSAGMTFSTFAVDPADKEQKKLLYKMKQNPDERLSDNVGKEIEMIGFVAHSVELPNAETGEMTKTPRIVILGADGVSFSAVSIGVYHALVSITRDLWTPSEENPITVKARRVRGKHGYDFLTLELA